jgi:hypothetical protein
MNKREGSREESAEFDLAEGLPETTQRVLARLHARAWGIALGVLVGGSLFVATMILVVRGGPQVGAHLGLLAAVFPGYTVSTGGAFIGFVYGFVAGYAVGRTIAVLYNAIARN